MILRTCFLCASLASVLFGRWDYGAWAGGRTLPKGAAVQGTLGYSHAIWGDIDSNDPLGFGYVRPNVTLTTSVITNRLGGSVEIYPIPILALAVGGFAGSRGANTDTIDCAENECRGAIFGSHFDVRITLGAHGIFLKGSASIQNVHSSSADRPFSEEWTALVGKAGGDRFVTGELILGTRVLETLLAGVSLSTARATETNNSNLRLAAFSRFTSGNFSYAVQLGSYRSSHHPEPGVFLGGSVTWAGNKAPKP